MSNERYVCPKVAAMEVNVNAETIRRWLREGKIPGKKIAGTWFVPEDFVERAEK